MSTRIGYYDGSGPAKVTTLTAAKTVTEAESGTDFIFGAATGAAVTLPAPKPGLRYRFTTGLAFGTTAWTIVTAGAATIIQGHVLVNDSHVPGTNEHTITFAHAADTLGDFVEMFSDGTNWYIHGSADAAGGITLTAA